MRFYYDFLVWWRDHRFCYYVWNRETQQFWGLENLQIVPSLLCLLILPFIPESPRWPMYKDRREEALEVLAIMATDGDISDAVVIT